MFNIVQRVDSWMTKQWERIKTVAFLTLMGAFLYAKIEPRLLVLPRLFLYIKAGGCFICVYMIKYNGSIDCAFLSFKKFLKKNSRKKSLTQKPL